MYEIGRGFVTHHQEIKHLRRTQIRETFNSKATHHTSINDPLLEYPLVLAKLDSIVL